MSVRALDHEGQRSQGGRRRRVRIWFAAVEVVDDGDDAGDAPSQRVDDVAVPVVTDLAS